MNTLARKAWGDLTRRRTRTLLAAFTLSIAITSLGFLAVPGLLTAAMNRQVAGSHLFDVGISTSVIKLSPAQLGALGHLPGIAAVNPDLGYVTSATSVAGTANIAIAGGDLASAPVDTVPLLSGRLPGPGEVLADAANGRATDYAIPDGGFVEMRAASGAMVRLRVSGTGLNLAATPGANGSATPEAHRRVVRLRHLGPGRRGQPGARPSARSGRVAARPAPRAAQARGRNPGRHGHQRIRLRPARPSGRAQRPAGQDRGT